LRARPTSNMEKPLPREPVPPNLQHRPDSEPVHAREHPAYVRQNAVAGPSSPPRTFKPSPYLVLPTLHTRRPLSDSAVDTSPVIRAKPTTPLPITPKRTIAKSRTVIDLTYSPASTSSADTPPSKVTPRSPARIRKRATSEQPPKPRAECHPRNTGQGDVSRSPTAKDASGGIRCAGFTRAGQPCKRVVKAAAPLLASLDLNLAPNTPSGDFKGGTLDQVGNGNEVMGRYCKDHAGMICSASGFYPRDNPGVWVAFDGESA
jgi:hypothetical protein